MRDYQSFANEIKAGSKHYGLVLTGPDATWQRAESPDTKRMAILEAEAYQDKIWLKDLNASALWGTGKHMAGYERGFVIYAKEPEMIYKAAFDFQGAHQTPWPDLPAPLAGYFLVDIFKIDGPIVSRTIPLMRFYHADSLAKETLDQAGAVL